MSRFDVNIHVDDDERAVYRENAGRGRRSVRWIAIGPHLGLFMPHNAADARAFLKSLVDAAIAMGDAINEDESL